MGRSRARPQTDFRNGRDSGIIQTILSILYVAITTLIVTPFGVAAFLLSLLGLKGPMSVFLYWICIGWSRALIKIIGCRVTVTGRENIPRSGGVCFVSNHGGMFDIVLLLAYSCRLFGFVAKKELIYLPFMNIWVYMLGGLLIDRKNPRKALKTINSGIVKIRKGGAMLIFPEGHRSRGQGLLPFHPGSLKLATQSGAVIIPVAIKGSWEIFEKNYRLNVVPVSITFCKPIATAELPVEDRKQVLADKIYNVINEQLTDNK